ncbi:hypothetical protein TNIN_303611 [Trichonephila inaurata madagascariensis]|uniref:Uncharacterized protein n=1 Tax=Trichonephila inaurata madagascariensis TaxID=2747483 RepID=A0A8X7BS72_9ARAC|nr:hypothetical protein TNIN_303611 [Trichonephila inaurata madagascariensis]
MKGKEKEIERKLVLQNGFQPVSKCVGRCSLNRKKDSLKPSRILRARNCFFYYYPFENERQDYNFLKRLLRIENCMASSGDLIEVFTSFHDIIIRYIDWYWVGIHKIRCFFDRKAFEELVLVSINFKLTSGNGTAH